MATGTRGPPSSWASPSSTCWYGCACRATRSSALEHFCSRGSSRGTGSCRCTTQHRRYDWPDANVHRVLLTAHPPLVASKLALSPSLLAAAPHRLLFFTGAANVLLAMLWWTLWLVDARWQLFKVPQPAVYAGWMHAIVMQYQVLTPFIFGFLLTVFPRWMNQPALTRWHYLPVGFGLLGGQVLTLAGLAGFPSLLHAGAVLGIAGWALGFGFLLRLLCRDAVRTWHAVSCVIALAFGLVGFVLYAAYLHVNDARLMAVAIKIGTFGLLLPIFVTVAHRMFPFFASAVIIGHTGWRPMPWLAVFWVLAVTHLELDSSYT